MYNLLTLYDYIFKFLRFFCLIFFENDIFNRFNNNNNYINFVCEKCFYVKL